MSDATLRTLLANAPAEAIFEFVGAELERLAWQFILWPPAAEQRLHATPQIREIAALLEVMPDVYLHSVQLIGDRGMDRFIRLWCRVRHADGTVEERPLFCSFSDTYPGPESSEYRPGMDSGLDWWYDIRAQLISALATHRTELPLVPPGDTLSDQLLGADLLAGVSLQTERPLPADEVGQLLARGDMGDLAAFLSQRDAVHSKASPRQGTFPPPHEAAARSTAGPARSTASPASPAASSTSLHPPPTLRELAESRRQLEVVFGEWTALREQAYAQRDALANQVRDAYFVLYPVMREAAKLTSAVNIEQVIGVWIEQGCPPPNEERAPDLPPGVSEEMLQRTSRQERLIGETAERARRLAVEWERTKSQVQERSRIIERICELLGGHDPRMQRDVETGAPVTICGRCDARLHAQVPGVEDGWTR